MSKHEIRALPTDSSLAKMTLEELTDLSAKITGGKQAYQEEYRKKQIKLHSLMAIRSKEEQDERIKNDPAYWDKHQGVGGPRV